MSKDRQFRLAGKHVLIGMILFFSGVIAANGWMSYQAPKVFDGVGREDGSRKGRDYNKTIEEAQRQAELGWQIALVAEVNGFDLEVTLNVDVRDAQGNALNDLDIQAVLWRPVESGQELDAALDAVGAGRYQATMAVPTPGQWDVKLAILDRAGHRLDHRERITIKAAV